MDKVFGKGAISKEDAQKEEDRRMKAFRFLTDLTRQRLYIEPMTLAEARGLIDELRQTAERFFPGKGNVFDLVIAPRMERILRERFGSGAKPGGEVH
ncbi:MAG: hypothetical protein JSV26_05310 [bacterium]|nr:MAG: hypothetical protein JSV26_05310 [bacterium]